MISPSPSDEVRCVFTSAKPLVSISVSYLLRSAAGRAGSKFLSHGLRLPSLKDRPRPWTVTQTLPFHAAVGGKDDGHRGAFVALVLRDREKPLSLVRRLREDEIGRVGEVLLVVAGPCHESVDGAVEADVEARKRRARRW